MPHKYELIVSWSEDDRAFVARVPELPGCMAHGSTPAEAVAEAEQAIALWLETARELGRPIPEPGRRTAAAQGH
jgi:predicted RNase H-like HicB family nuclease